MYIMKISFAVMLVSATFLVLACGGSAQSPSAAGAAGAAGAPVVAASAASPAGKGECILSYQRKMDELLPLAVIKKHYVGDMTAAKMSYRKSKPEDDASTDEYAHSWPSGRTRVVKMGEMTTEVPIKNQIGVKWVGSDLFMISGKPTPLENFKAFYRNPTQEQLDAAFKMAEARIKGDPNYTKEQAETAIGMAKGMSARDKFEDVAGLGDAASFNKEEDTLMVLAGATVFMVVASVGEDKAVNLELAKKLANEVLARCD